MKRTFAVITCFILCFIIILVGDRLNGKEKNEEKINFEHSKLNSEIVLEPFVKSKRDKEKWYVGTWVKPDKWMGGTTFEVIDSGEQQVKVIFSDFTYGGGVGRAASFETKPFRLYEEIEDTLYHGRFAWDSANGGFGYLYISEHEANLVLQTTKHGGGAINQVNGGGYTFKIPKLPRTVYALKKIQDQVNMNQSGFIPDVNLTYIYLSVDGESTSRNIYNVEEKTFEHLINWKNKKTYHLTKKSMYLIHEDETDKDEILRFSMKKGDKWKSEGIDYEVIEDDYPLIIGLGNIIVLKETTEKRTKFNYYHKQFGLLGRGVESNNKHGHEPVYLLDDIEFN